MAEAPLNRNAIRRISFHVFRLSVLLLAFARSAWGGGIGLAWDSVDSPSIAGYMVYYGPSAGTYTGKIDVAKQTAYTISNLPDGATYHFTVTAYDASRVESSFSNDAVGTAGAGASGSTRAEAVTTTVVEYFNPSLAQYFMTSDSIEISVLDNGSVEGWSRTGATFKAYVPSDAGPLGVTAVCRFYGRPEAGLDGHFYSASPDECDAVLTGFAAEWVLESRYVFYVYLPDTGTGACPEGTVPVYRVYDKRADSNHRYTTSVDVLGKMTDQGWIAEGYGSEATAMCTPP